MSWLKKWFGREEQPASPQVPQAQGQVRMTLNERMAFRREMVFESVRDALLHHGVLTTGYRLHVARMDARGHCYSAMIDLITSGAGRVIDSRGELHAMESRIAQAAMSRYRIKVANVYWRFDDTGDSSAGLHAPLEGGTVTRQPGLGGQRTQSESPAAPRQPIFRRRATDKLEDFPDTQVEERSLPEEGVTPDELMAFERALQQSKPSQPVKVGARTYETDFLPLD